ncbi:DUF423 domain-containing protein [Sulfuriroseicoccus oceanibius]|uniref:DUF423 domain-containing protein n=1 Tax=Sulfuriroseicoccus oceanibius TaxID=2707525 RepID=A0A6B3L4P1_9BACT|nr:DUF423 domain-containing protein [Sulfuriroseicoccus oceanibius]QQL44023.1 DUF423 domain-containing protein [Sulfuriroseicoccus oceanibius]
MARFIIAGINGAIAVAAGASGAHGKWAEHLDEIGRLDQWQTGVHYQMVHAVVLLVLALAIRVMPDSRAARIAFALIFAGVFLFSGSLYVLCMTDVSKWGAVTPFGGLSMIAGWIACCFCSKRQK